jgi:uncharacterized protein (TIGR02145 family)
MKTKALFIILSFLLFSNEGFSQAPDAFKYQSMLRNADGSAMANVDVSIRISILEGDFSGPTVYSELHAVTTNDFGIINLTIGEGTDQTGSISTIDWSAHSYFIKIEMDETGGTDYTLSSTSQLLSVPYALYAARAGNVDSLFSLIQLLQNGVTDYDGNHYNTKMIGDQIWMTENLKTTHYSNGDSIGTTYPFDLDISGESTPEYQWAYGGDEESMVPTYGRLYTWYTVNDERGVCPSGWHVPSDDEWTTLTDYLGGNEIAGGKMKETGTVHWDAPNTDADNSSGFTGLPGGNRLITGSYANLGVIGMWWTSTESNANNAWRRYLHYANSSVARQNLDKKNAFSIRCTRD